MSKEELKRARCDKIIVIALSLMILFGAAAFLLLPKTYFSEEENRVLAKAPTFSASAFFSGKLMRDAETYLSEHFPFRVQLLNLKVRSEILTGKTENNGVIISSEGYLFSDFRKTDEKQLENVVKTVNGFASLNSEKTVYLMIVPNSLYVNRDYLPMFYAPADQRQMVNELYAKAVYAIPVDIFDALQSENAANPVFYQTDHHWTTYGAFAAYNEFCLVAGLTQKNISGYEITEVSAFFSGTMAAKACLFDAPTDKIVRFDSESEKNLTVEYYDGMLNLTKTADTPYDEEYLSTRDKYSSFLSANNPLVVIKNSAVTNKKRIAVIKDSFANCFVPFLADDYAEIYVVDLRYFAYSISDILNEKEIGEVLILYNLENLNTDMGIFRLK